MKNKFFWIVLLVFLSIASYVFGLAFTSTLTPTTVNSGTINQTLNFTITNNNATANITQVNITFPSGFTFVSDSNSTNATNWIFTSGTSSANWTNSSSVGIVANLSSAWFGFKVNVPLIFSKVNFTVTTLDTSGISNSTNVSITVEPEKVSTPNRSFGIVPSMIFLNWTNTPNKYQQNITVMINSSFSEALLEVVNTSYLCENYTQENTNFDCSTRFSLLVQNASGYGTTFNLTSGNTNFTLIHNKNNCWPGRYYTDRFTIKNSTIDNLNISVTVNIPISTENSINSNMNRTGIGSFKGKLPANATTYHSYFFNTSEVTNATGVYVNISEWSSSQDIDLFLFDDSTPPRLLAKSINKTGTSESLFYNFLPTTPAMYEIRLYGTSTLPITYNGNIIFTTLDSTNRTLDFGIKNANNVTTQEFTLDNIGNLTLSSVVESKEIYWIKRISDSGTKNFTFIVPDSSIASKVKISLNWTGASNYSFNLYKPDNVLAGSSVNKYVYANVTGAMQEEYNETTDITKGSWRVEVKNNTPSIDIYTLTIYMHVNSSQWIASNYTTFTFINRTYNNSRGIQINFTIPNNTMDGIYEGYLRYTSASGSLINIPIRVNVTTPMLVVNGTLESATFQIDENYGFDLTRNYDVIFTNNTGFYDLVVNLTDSNKNLTCVSSGCSGYKVYFTYNIFSTIGNYSYQTLNVNVTYNSSLPQGSYEGWIYINATNETIALTSHPYTGFNISLRLNLTNLLSIKITDVVTADGNEIIENTTTPENITLKIVVSYLNGTNITGLNTTNFTSIWIYEPNASYRYPTTGSLTPINNYSLTNSLEYFGAAWYWINTTVPAGLPGGRYRVYSLVNHSRVSFNYGGEGVKNPLIINNTGLYMNTSTSSINIPNQTPTSFTINLYNFGPLTASSAIVYFSNTGCPITSVTAARNDCGGGGSATSDNLNVTFNLISGSESRNCNNITWSFTGTGSGSCTATIYGTNNKWFNNISLPISVSATTANVTPTPSPSPGPSPTPTPEPAKHMDITSFDPLIQIAQGNSSSTTVTVKNTNTTKTQDIKLSVENITSTWFSVSPALTSVSPGNSTTFTVTFTIPSTAEIKNYNGVFRAISNYANVSKSFTLKVLPSEAQKTTINQTLASYRANMTQLSLEINQSKSKGLNVTFAEAKLLELKVKIEQAEGYANQGDYFNAYQLLSSIQILIDETKAELAKAKGEAGKGAWLPFEWQSWMTFVIIGAGAAIAVFLVFLFWPKGKPKGIPTPKILEKPKELIQPKQESAWEQLKEKWAKIKKEKK